MLTNIQSTPQQASRVSVIDIKSILALLPDEISMRTLTVAIRQHCLQAHQARLKDYFLRFFLQCECKLKKPTSAQWHRVINNQLKKIVGVQNIWQFVKKKLLSWGLAKMQRLSLMNEPTIEQKMDEEFEELRGMEISEDVKIKTRFFFKWCQFLEEKRELKRMKSRQVENLRKAKQFHQECIKFRNFTRWKQYISRVCLAKQRGLALEQKTRVKRLTSILSEIKQKIDIINIEKMLEEAVYKKLQNLQLKHFFQKFRFARQRATSISTSLREKNNIWLYRFYNFLTKDSLPLMNKASVLARREREYTFERICLLNSWKGLKALVKKTALQASRIKYLLRKANLSSFVGIRKQMREQNLKRQQTQLLVKKNQFVLLRALAKSEEQKTIFFKEREDNIQKHVITSSLKWLFRQLTKFRAARKNLKQKLTNFNNSQHTRNKRYLLVNLKDFKHNKQQILELSQRVQSAHLLKTLQTGIRSHREWKASWKQIKNDLNQKYSKRLLARGWKGLKQTKMIKAGELQVFSSLTQLLESKILSDVFSFLKDRHERSNQIQTLFDKAQLVVKKVAFITILNRMLSKKMKVKSFAAKHQAKLKRKLFDWLLANQVHMVESGTKIRQIYSRIMKRQLLNRLREGLEDKESLQKADYLLQLRSKTQSLLKIKICMLKSKQYDQASEVVCVNFKKRRFGEFLSTIKQLSVFREEEDEKSLKVAKKIVRNYLKTFRLNVKRNKNRRETEAKSSSYFEQKVRQVRMSITTSVLEKMLRRSEPVITKKYSLVRHSNLRGIFKMLRLNNDSKSLRTTIRQSKASQIIQCMRQNATMKLKRKLLLENINKNWLSDALKNIQENLQAQELQLNEKIEEVREAVHQGRVKRYKQMLVSRLRGHFELKENAMILLNTRTRQSCKEMVRLHLRYKSKAIKEFVALRHYATNVKRRAMRALKCTMNVSVLKENKNKIENHSKLIMEKSIDNARKKSKLIETIERYNLSRVSRVIR